jgi:hypothetical protein
MLCTIYTPIQAASPPHDVNVVFIGMGALDLYDWQIIIFIGVVSTVTLLSLIGNALTVHIFTHTPSLSILPNCYIISQSTANYIHAGIIMPVSAYFNLVVVTREGCQFWIIMGSFYLHIYILSHVAIIINRYIATTWPLPHVTEIRCYKCTCNMHKSLYNTKNPHI